MLRMVAVLMVVAMGALGGSRMAGKLKHRRDALAMAVGCIQRMMLAIEHTNRPIQEILLGLEGPEVLKVTAQGMEQGLDLVAAWESASASLKNDGLTGEDRKEIDSFVAALGKSGRASQQELGKMAVSALSGRLREAEACYAQKGRVYRTMGLLMGTGLAILLL